MLGGENLSCGEDRDNLVAQKIGHIPPWRYGRHSPGVAGPQDLEQLKKDDHAYRALWSAVILQAMKDFFELGSLVGYGMSKKKRCNN